jgi:hypothetical protein
LLRERGSTQIPFAVCKLSIPRAQNAEIAPAFAGKLPSSLIHDKPGLRLDPVAPPSDRARNITCVSPAANVMTLV